MDKKTADRLFRLHRVLAALQVHHRSHGRYPGKRELSRFCQIPYSTVATYLNELREYGLVDWEKGRPNTLRVVRTFG